MNYKHTYPKEGKEFTTDITFNSGSGTNNAQISNYYYNPDGTRYSDPRFVNNRGDNNNNQLTVQLDYVNPISTTSKIEIGARAFRNNNTNLLNSFSVNNGNEVKLPLSTNVKYDETIFAGYATYSNSWREFATSWA